MMRTPSKHERHAAAALVAAALLCSHTAGAQEIALTYTAAQAQRGKAAYEPDCLPCHGANLNDGPLGPPLKGPSSSRSTAARRPTTCSRSCARACPRPRRARSNRDAYAAIMAYVLQQNDIVAGDAS